MLFLPASLAPKQRTAAEGIQGGRSGRGRPARLLPGSSRPPAFPGSHQRGTRAPSVPSRGRRREGGRGREIKGLLLSSLPFRRSDRLRQPRWKSSAAEQAPSSSRDPVLGSFAFVPTEGKERGKEEKEKPQTSLEDQLVGRAWSACPRLGRSGTLKTPGGLGAPGPRPHPPRAACPRPPPASPVLGVSPEVAATQAGRGASKPVSSSGADSWEAAGAGGAPRRCPLLPRRNARIESSPTPGTASISLREASFTRCLPSLPKSWQSHLVIAREK